MRTKATFLIGAATGYVLGAKAGRERYDQIATAAGTLWSQPKVQQTVGEVRGKAMAAADSTIQTAKAKVVDLREQRSSDDVLTDAVTPPVMGAYDDAVVPAFPAPAGSNGHPV